MCTLLLMLAPCPPVIRGPEGGPTPAAPERPQNPHDTHHGSHGDTYSLNKYFCKKNM